jgi:hypothetical protein
VQSIRSRNRVLSGARTHVFMMPLAKMVVLLV